MRRKKRQILRGDRRKELRLRLAAKRAQGEGHSSAFAIEYGVFPERELLDRIIERVRRL
jgi:hypothetical protein